jgi:hypothetical protein
VLTVSETLFDVLACATEGGIVAAAEAWSSAGGVHGLDAARAAEIVEALVGLAKRCGCRIPHPCRWEQVSARAEAARVAAIARCWRARHDDRSCC